MSKPKLHIIVGSTRQERASPAIAAWFLKVASAHGAFEPTLVDLKEIDLPLLDEPKHPRFRDYQFDHTKRWSAIVDAADAYVFVTPEYNYGASPALLNALDYLSQEWAYKPAAFVSYGGVSGGTRSVQMTKQVVTSLRIMPIPEAVSVPFFTQHVKEGVFQPPEAQETAAKAMLTELARWSTALATLRPKPIALSL
jgi:NAD(P)H-dependent FMN reductase